MSGTALREVRGDLWGYHGRAVVAVTTCGRVDRKGERVRPLLERHFDGRFTIIHLWAVRAAGAKRSRSW